MRSAGTPAWTPCRPPSSKSNSATWPPATQRRRQLAARYDALFAAANLTGPSTAEGIVLPLHRPRATHVFHQYVIRAPRRDALRAHLTAHHVGSEIYYPLCLHQQKRPRLPRLQDRRLPPRRARRRRSPRAPHVPRTARRRAGHRSRRHPQLLRLTSFARAPHHLVLSASQRSRSIPAPLLSAPRNSTASSSSSTAPPCPSRPSSVPPPDASPPAPPLPAAESAA